ncbi:hypothetical protein SAMN05421693_1247 [Ectothiorhodospira magna]|uniref:DUF2066 domain-containing protein n=1 Tax=Ectothiorhodospira magna TaxID=867345 RepID=A0A1H9F3W1_9GAMM|nr:DUF2066 domain-containing protein [Ectothiorhodospira magna]SEQ31908.1 hypothetical protein SAMN05421693_1247 [Ectothiorhodospira magna]
MAVFVSLPRQRVRLSLLLLLLAGPLMGAEPPANLLEAEVAVTTRDAPERTQALGKAMAQVVVRLTGQRDMANDDRVADLLAQAPRHVQQYRYLEDPDLAQLLWVRFDGVAVIQHLRAAGLPVWSGDRPALLVWLGVQEDQGRQLVAAADRHPVRTALERTAWERGLPLLFPLMDLEDQRRVGLADVMGGFHEPLLEASRRYSPGGVLVVRVLPSGTHWLARMQLFTGETWHQWEASDPTPAMAVSAALHQVADDLGRRLARAGSAPLAQDGVLISVSGVASLADYLRVAGYLGNMPVVSHLRPHGVLPDRSVFRVQLQGDAHDLVQAVRLGTTLVPESGGDPAQGMDTIGFRLP